MPIIWVISLFQEGWYGSFFNFWLGPEGKVFFVLVFFNED
jgi:hypothetical protein